MAPGAGLSFGDGQLSFGDTIPRVTTDMAAPVLKSSTAPLRLKEIEHSVPVGTLVLVQEAARELGADGDALLLSIGVDPSALRFPMTPIPLRVAGRALLRARQITGSEHLPALAGARAKFGNAGLVPLLVMQERFVRDAIVDLTRFLRIWFRGIRFSLEVSNGLARFAITMVGSFEGRAELSTFYAASMNRHLQTIIGAGWKAARVTLEQRKPADPRPYRQVFNAPVLFGESQTAIDFAAGDLDVTRETTDEHLTELLRKQLMGMESKAPASLAEEVQRLIEVMLPRGDCTIERVAELFSMHRKTLHRHLAAQGTSFTKELELARRAFAERLLAERQMSVAEVASALGYKDPVNFTRAFRAWYGVPPNTWRRTHAHVPVR